MVILLYRALRSTPTDSGNVPDVIFFQLKRSLSLSKGRTWNESLPLLGISNPEERGTEGGGIVKIIPRPKHTLSLFIYEDGTVEAEGKRRNNFYWD
jgi:hypothetical protein